MFNVGVSLLQARQHRLPKTLLDLGPIRVVHATQSQLASLLSHADVEYLFAQTVLLVHSIRSLQLLERDVLCQSAGRHDALAELARELALERETEQSVAAASADKHEPPLELHVAIVSVGATRALLLELPHLAVVVERIEYFPQPVLLVAGLRLLLHTPLHQLQRAIIIQDPQGLTHKPLGSLRDHVMCERLRHGYLVPRPVPNAQSHASIQSSGFHRNLICLILFYHFQLIIVLESGIYCLHGDLISLILHKRNSSFVM